MKHNLLKSVIISVILLMGVSNAWGYTISSAKIYYDDSNSKWGSNVVVAFDKNDGGAVFAMTKINNTSLHYWTGTWGDNAVSYMRFGQTTKTYNWYGWGDYAKSTWDLSQNDKWTGVSGGWGLNINNEYKMFGAESNSSGADLTKTDLNGYSSLNYNQTVQQHLSTNGSAYAASTASIATVKVSSYKLSSATATAAASKTIVSGTSTATCSAARTATVTYSVTGVNTGYKFVGWYDGNTQKSTSTTYTYPATGEKTITARFENTYAVTISAGANGNVSPTGSQQVGYSTTTTIKATANTGYKFKNWTKTGGVVIANANNATTSITATATGTVTANFEEDLTSTWHIVGTPTSIFKGTSTWAAHDDNMLKKTTGASTASKGSLTIDVKTLPADNDSYQFKVLNTNGTKWYGWSTGDNHYWMNKTNTTGVYTDQNNLYFIPNALGDYKFDVDWSNSNPSLKVTFPTAYTVTFGKGTGGSSVTAKYNSTSFNSGTKVQSGKTVTFTQTPSAGYAFKGWNTKSDGTGTTLSTNETYTHTVAATNTIYAIYTKKPDKTIYLEPTGHWNPDKAVFQAHVWQTGKTGVNLNMIGVGEPSYADSDNKSPYKYYKVEIPAEYDNILFFRKDNFATANENAWNKTGDLTIPTDDKVLYTITSAGKGKSESYSPAATGVWKKADLTYDVTLYSSKFGEYGFTLDGQTYTSPESGSIVYQVPIGATVQLFANPYNEAYNDDLMMNQGGTRTEVSANNTSLTINCNTILDDNYKTTGPHVVYLAVPNNGGGWVTNAATEHYAYAFHSRTDLTNDKQEIQMTLVATVYVEQVPHFCYRCVIPAGYNTIRFEKRTSGGVTNIKTVDLNYQIPFNIVNCYRLNGTSGSLFTGVWETLPAITDDYRILYVEQTVEYGEIIFDKSHASDIVKLTNTGDEAIVSLHLYNKRAEGVNGMNNAAVILQRCTGYDEGVAQWEEVEYHMVYNRLFSEASAALLPGRRNTVELRDHDGLEVIKAVADSEEHDYGSGVWNFTIRKTDGSATLLLDENHLKPYEGNYYIRTSNAEGGWINYSIPANHMTFSSYAKKNSDFSHYFCKWVNTSEDTPNVKFVIANDYGANISKELAGDEIIGQGTSDLPANANVRWQWNMVTNEVKRAYIQGSTVQNFLTVTESDETTTKFRDNGNWIYEADITANVNEKITAITAPYKNQNQSLLEETYQTSGMPMLTGDGENTSDYTVRVQYDFKINKTIALLIPGGQPIATAIDVLIERVDQRDATQVSVPITASNIENGYTVYAAMSFTKDHINGSGTQSEKLYYWVSFPFDVRISDVFGFGEYGVHWIMEYYDGAERAEKGCWADSPTYWRYITDTTSVDIPDDNKNLNCGILKANQGYVLALALNIANMGIFTNTDKVSLYFPSMSPITTEINGDIIETTVILDEYKCNIERDNRKIHDSNWHIIGVPSFSHKQQTLTQGDLLYFYTRDQQNDTYEVTSTKGSSITFKSLHSYMVQYAGTINWAATWTLSQPQGLAAKRNANEEKTHSLRLELSQNGTYNDQTLVTLQEEGATEAFDMNLDLSKMMNAGNNIYTLAGEELIQVAGNALPIANTTIPVGVQIATAGEYTFAMPDGTDGIIVELIDYETNTRTNLLLSDYTVNLPAGTCETRFALSVKIDKTATSVENITEVEGANGEGVKKYIIDGKLFLQKDGMLYDAQGHIVR